MARAGSTATVAAAAAETRTVVVLPGFGQVVLPRMATRLQEKEEKQKIVYSANPNTDREMKRLIECLENVRDGDTDEFGLNLGSPIGTAAGGTYATG